MSLLKGNSTCRREYQQLFVDVVLQSIHPSNYPLSIPTSSPRGLTYPGMTYPGMQEHISRV